MTVNNSLTQTQETFSTFITKNAIKTKINTMIGDPKEGTRFISAILSTVAANPELQKCDHNTIISAALLGESLKLSPSPQLGQYYLVPFKDKNNNRIIATFVLGYKGYIQLAIRSGYYKKINVLAIKEGELVKYDPLTEHIEVKLIDDDELREATPTIGYYAMFEYTSGFTKAIYWSRRKMELHADKFSKAFKLAEYKKLQEGKIPESDMWKYSSFWYKDFDGMAFKTMLRQLISKWGIMSIDMQIALENDVADFRDSYDYVDAESAKTEAEPAEPAEIKPEQSETGKKELDEVFG